MQKSFGRLVSIFVVLSVVSNAFLPALALGMGRSLDEDAYTPPPISPTPTYPSSPTSGKPSGRDVQECQTCCDDSDDSYYESQPWEGTCDYECRYLSCWRDEYATGTLGGFGWGATPVECMEPMAE